MKKILCSFSGRAYDESTKWTVHNGCKFGADEVVIYDDKWLMTTDFYRENIKWWSRKDAIGNRACAGFGWWTWKAFLLKHVLDTCSAGDIVLYIDGDTYPIADLTPLYRECDRTGPVMLFEAQGFKQENWCKRDCYITMNQDEPQYRGDAKAGVARFMLFQKSPFAEAFLDEWLMYCLNDYANTFDPSVLAPEYPELKEHRCEQAIMTNLGLKYGLKFYREACENGEVSDADRDIYPQLFIQSACDSALRANRSGSKWRSKCL